MSFESELKFEENLVKVLIKYGWEEKVLMCPTEEDLLNNWAQILFDNNRSINRLNNYPLTKGEMAQIIEQINTLRTPLKLNGFINGRVISIKRDNPQDKEHFGKEISLKIYDRREIAAGQSRYQIARQPRFSAKSKMLNDRRGDIMLLINGMPVIHIELKKSGVPLSQAYNQIEKYSYEGVFRGLFSLVQIFVAMTPEETVYFANPGPDGKFNQSFYFHWADFNNEPINDWKSIASTLLSIPMAHQLIGFYTVADNADGVLKVMRSYQYYAANAISDKVAKNHWKEGNQLGGYVWHTTGSGKTMTSFKSAQLIADSGDADKVVFLCDRIELGTQSVQEYRSFAGENEEVQDTENTYVLIKKLKSDNPSDTLIVTSIQKMSRIKEDGLKEADLNKMRNKRIVFIVDEAHRSTFGDMLITIKDTFENALFFGFTGTPIFEENEIKKSHTSMIFGNELHRYSIADGIRDKNVLGFDTDLVMTFKEKDLRSVIGLSKANAKTTIEAMNDPAKRDVYLYYMQEAKMAGYCDDSGKYVMGIEDYISNSQYKAKEDEEYGEHQKKVVEDIKENWPILSLGGKFHAIFATSSIKEAIQYYLLIKKEIPELKITALFDSNIDNDEVKKTAYKEEGLLEILEDYNLRYHTSGKYTIPTHALFKKDVAARLAHKKAYKFIDNDPSKQLDLLIVVDQMLTGFDSKWINTLYLDKVLEYANIIQAFSRTNRIFNNEKRHGTIRYYRFPHTMKREIEKAFRLYSGDKPFGVFVDKLPENIKHINFITEEIKDIFEESGVYNFEKLPEDVLSRAKFAKKFKELNDYLDAAKIQGFKWKEEDSEPSDVSETILYESWYNAMLARYKELATKPQIDPPTSQDPIYDIAGYLTEIDTGMIDYEYLNDRFNKWYKLLKLDDASQEAIDKALEDLHKNFSTLSQDEQKYGYLFLHDVQSGDVEVDMSKTFKDYILEYQSRAQNDRIHKFADTFGIDENMLREMMSLNLNEDNINEFNRFENIVSTVNKSKAKSILEEKEGAKLNPIKVNAKIDKLLRSFIISGGFDI